jgi:hypothetical protein
LPAVGLIKSQVFHCCASFASYGFQIGPDTSQ